MKIFAFCLLIGLASASFHEELDDARNDLVHNFLLGMEHIPFVRRYVEDDHIEFADKVDDDIKTELGKTLKDGLDRVLKKIKEAVDEGREVRTEFLDKVKELRDKLRDIRVDVGERSKELMRDIKKKARDYLKELLESFGLGKRSAGDRIEEAFSELNFKDVLQKIREHLRKNVDPELLKEKIEKIAGQASELLDKLLRVLKEKGRRKLEILIDSLLDEEEEERRSRGIKDYWEKVKEYFKDLKIDLQEKYLRFGEWVKEKFGNGMEVSKDKMENIKAIAREFMRHAKNVSKEVGSEASEFFRQYKEDLGNIWEELKETFQQIKNRQN